LSQDFIIFKILSLETPGNNALYSLARAISRASVKVLKVERETRKGSSLEYLAT